MRLEERAKAFALDVLRLCDTLPQKSSFWGITRQLMRSATSVGANYRSAGRAKSRTDFVAKMAIVEEEADESLYWMELIEALLPTPNTELHRLADEANQIVAMVVASKKTARRNAE